MLDDEALRFRAGSDVCSDSLSQLKKKDEDSKGPHDKDFFSCYEAYLLEAIESIKSGESLDLEEEGYSHRHTRS